MRFISVQQPWHQLATWKVRLAEKEKWVVTGFFLWLSFFCTQVVLFDQTVICLQLSKRLPTWSFFTPRQVTRVVH